MRFLYSCLRVAVFITLLLFQAASRNESAHLAGLSLAVASVLSQVQSMSSAVQTLSVAVSPSVAAAGIRCDENSVSTPSVIEQGKAFKACVVVAAREALSWPREVPSEPEKQMKIAVERRLQLSSIVQKCGGQHMFAAAAAATVDEYIKWAGEELKKDDGQKSKVRG
jgi:hypothetical protein